MGFAGETMSALLKGFDQALLLHATKVRNAYDRVFAEPIENLRSGASALTNRPATLADTAGTENHLLQDAAHVFMLHLTQAERQTANVGSLARLLSESVAAAINPRRALILTTRVAASLGKSEGTAELTQNALTSLVQLCGSSEFFGEMLASYPALVATLSQEKARARRRDYRAQLRAAIEAEKSFPAELAALRREWSRLLIEIGAEDAAGKINLLESNQLQTELAISSINVAYLVARRELARRYGPLRGGPRLSVLALGRLASGGVDYGSDLDITFVYDSLVSSPSVSLTPDEAYGRLVELMITALSSVTREGYLYRVDLRLRPNGKNGPLVSSSEGFLEYVRQRSAIWEWLAYVKLRAVAGDLELGKMVETHARHAVHERARAIDSDELRQETRRVRERLEREKGAGHKEPRRGGLASAGNRIATKYSAGGMLDVYFAARYLQLRDEVPDEGDDRSTRATLARLETSGSLTVRDHEVLSSGYELLRAVDHQLRLIAGKVAALPSPDYPAYQEITERLGFASPVELSETLRERMCAIREAYERITS
jgi:glutamate-ammonia-ligase adenylyltransferase